MISCSCYNPYLVHDDIIFHLLDDADIFMQITFIGLTLLRGSAAFSGEATVDYFASLLKRGLLLKGRICTPPPWEQILSI